MNNQDSTATEKNNDLEQPEWHPYRVWKNQIRAQQPKQVVKREISPVNLQDATGTWNTQMKNV